MARRVFWCALTALILCLAAATTTAAPSATTASTSQPRYTVCVRKPGAVAWTEYGSHRTMAEASAAARKLDEGGLEVQVHSWSMIANVSPLPKTGILPVAETVTVKQAAELFRWLADQRDIAFGYPSDGCYARTHLMICRMQERGYKPYKVWAFQNGSPLHAVTTNHPDGYVEWRYHMAPLLRVRLEGGKQRWYVIDPSLFKAPATIARWRDALKKPGSRWSPYVTLTRVGQAPKDPHGMKLPGTGYWPGVDPREGLESHAVKMMRRYKPFEGQRPSRTLVANPYRGEKMPQISSVLSTWRDKSPGQVAEEERDGLVARPCTEMGRLCWRVIPPGRPYPHPYVSGGFPC